MHDLKLSSAQVNPEINVNYQYHLSSHIPSSTSLQERDWEALIELFDREDGEEIEDDINSSLLFLMPEPCWEDNPFDFLLDYL